MSWSGMGVLRGSWKCCRVSLLSTDASLAGVFGAVSGVLGFGHVASVQISSQDPSASAMAENTMHRPISGLSDVS